MYVCPYAVFDISIRHLNQANEAHGAAPNAIDTEAITAMVNQSIEKAMAEHAEKVEAGTVKGVVAFGKNGLLPDNVMTTIKQQLQQLGPIDDASKVSISIRI